MRYGIVKDGVIVNCVELNPVSEQGEKWLELNEYELDKDVILLEGTKVKLTDKDKKNKWDIQPGIGWRYDGKKFGLPDHLADVSIVEDDEDKEEKQK